MRRLVIALVATGCTSPPPTELTTSPAVPAAESSWDPAPWLGRLQHARHEYFNGCTDHRELEILALRRDRQNIPIILGWRRISPHYLPEPHFLTDEGEVPANARRTHCVLVTGAVVSYASQGIAGAPAYAIEATQIAPAACP